MNYCSGCSAPVVLKVPAGDTLARFVCTRCEAIYYQNPRMIVGCIAEWEGKILMCRRAIVPRYGFWTLPAGFMENDETTKEAARRETLEEACALVAIDALFSMINLPTINQVHLFYRGQLIAPVFSSGAESLETALFSETEIPWEDIAFCSITKCLKDYFSDRVAGSFSFHESDMTALY